MRSRLLLIEALDLGLDVAPHLTRRESLRPLADEAERAIVGRHELCEIALLGFEASRRGEIPPIFLPCRRREPDRFLVRFRNDEMHDESDHRLVTLRGQ